MGRKELQIVDLSGSRLDFKWKLQVNQINKDRNSDNSRLKWTDRKLVYDIDELVQK